MNRVTPYEHNVKIIEKYDENSNDQILELYNWFNEESDKWLKKIIALKILKNKDINSIKFIDLTKLKQAIKCQIEL